MRPFLAALYGGIVPFTAVVAAGYLVLPWLRIRRRAGASFPLAVALGSPVCAALHFALLRAGVVRRGHFYALAAALLAAAVAVGYKRTRERPPRPGNRFPGSTGEHLADSPEGVPILSRLEALLPVLLLAAVMAVFGWGYLLAAAGPDTTPAPFDASLAHAAAAVRSPRTAPAPSPSALLLVAPLALGGPSAAAVFHLAYLFTLACLCASAARRAAALWLDTLAAGWASFAAGSLVFASPALALAACDARVEMIGTLAFAAGLYFAVLALPDRSPAAAVAALAVLLLAPAAFTTGLAFPGFLFLPFSKAWCLIPFAAVAVAVLIARYRLILALVLAFHLSTNWSGAARLLAPPDLPLMPPLAWQDAATADRDAWLAAHLPGYIEARFLDESTHPSARIAVETPLARAWTTRHVVPFRDWEAILEAAAGQGNRANRVEIRRFSVLTGRYLPVVLTSPAAEIRLFHKGVEIARQKNWRLRCPEAFDNSLLTVCSGASAEIDFGSPVPVDEVRIHGFHGAPAAWPPGMRRAAIEEMKRAGITHIYLSDMHRLTPDLFPRARYWGLHDAGERARAHLYALD